MISDQTYRDYLNALLQGNRHECTRIVQNLLEKKIAIKHLYEDLFKTSLYHVGKLWEFNRITVADEHVATAITERVMSLVYPTLFNPDEPRKKKRMLVSCAANEFHQIGGKMIADIGELNGWDSFFLGANLPADHLLAQIQETKPDLVGLSLSVYFNMDILKQELEMIRTHFNHLDIIVGGQAFKWGGLDMIKRFSATEYIATVDEIEKQIR